MGMSRGTVCSQSDDYAGMLDCLVRIIQFGAYGTHILSLGIHQHLFHPVGRDDFRIIVQQ